MNTRTVLRIAAACLVPLAAAAQEAGHSTVPQTGPAAREAHVEPATDPLLVQVERLRRDLADLGKRYRKAAPAEREALARAALPLLDDTALRLRALADGTKR